MHSIQTGKFLDRIPFAKVGDNPNPVLVINGGQGFMMTPDAARISKDARRLSRLLPDDRSFILLGYDPEADRVTVESLAEDVEQIIDRHLSGRVDVVGISYGGVVASRLATRSPKKITKLILLAGAPWFSVEGQRRLRRQIDLVADGNFVALLREFTSMFRRPWLNFLMNLRIRLSGARLISRLGKPDVIRRYLGAMLDVEPQENGSISQETPVLLVGGSRDQFFAEPMVELSVRLPHVEASIFEGETHMVPIERAKAVKRVVTVFLHSS